MKFWGSNVLKFFFEHFLDAIIGGIIGGFIERYFAHSSERRRINKILIIIRNRIYSLLKEDYSIDELFESFKELKIFFNRNYELLEIPGNKTFYEKWLEDPSVDAYLTNSRGWYNTKALSNRNTLEEMLRDLNDTKSHKCSKFRSKILCKIEMLRNYLKSP